MKGLIILGILIAVLVYFITRFMKATTHVEDVSSPTEVDALIKKFNDDIERIKKDKTLSAQQAEKELVHCEQELNKLNKLKNP